jgi:drug/metabolite transporter superfamily protein YnfA
MKGGSCYKAAMDFAIPSGKLGAAAVFVGSAALEVAGDALIRKGLRGSGMALLAVGFAVLGAYGLLVNLLAIDFSRLLGAYVGVFAVVSVLAGRFVFQDSVPTSTWIGLAVILGGSLIIHLGRAG